jgi:glyoxylase-like metal-dependent hydrolase (beta-lactamase superfamily II)
MQVQVINTGFFKLDGGAMFGVVPKTLWEKLEQPDEQNLCTWAMRCLLILTDDGRKILVDTGLGNKQEPKFFSHYQPHGQDSLLASLAALGHQAEDITDVLITHFHFDHVGGAVLRSEQGQYLPTFPKARYWTNQAHYQWAIQPNARERASFLKENFLPLQELGVLHYLDTCPHDRLLDWLPGLSLQFAYGHTEAMMLPHVRLGDKTLVYCADLLPSPSHVPLPYVMAYDTRPLQTLTEKEWFLNKAVEEGLILFFEHAPHIQACTLSRDAKGKIVVERQGDLSLFL